MVAFPLLLIAFAIYNMVAFLLPGMSWTAAMFSLRMPSGAEWPSSASDLLIAFALFLIVRGMNRIMEDRKAAAAAPDDAATHAKLGAVFAERGMNERAATELETAVRLNPRDAASQKRLGYVYVALGKRDKAAAAFHEAMRQYVLVGDMVGGTEAEALEKKAKAGQPLGPPR